MNGEKTKAEHGDGLRPGRDGTSGNDTAHLGLNLSSSV